MAAALVEAASEHRTTSDVLLRLIAQQVQMLVRFQTVDRGGDDPGPLDLQLPGDPPPPKKSGLREQMRRAMGR